MIRIECGEPGALAQRAADELCGARGVLLIHPTLPAPAEPQTHPPLLIWISPGGVVVLDEDSTPAPLGPPALTALRDLLGEHALTRLRPRALTLSPDVSAEELERELTHCQEIQRRSRHQLGTAEVLSLLETLGVPESLTLDPVLLAEEGFTLPTPPLIDTSAAEFQRLQDRQRAGSITPAERSRLDQLDTAARRGGQIVLLLGVLILAAALVAVTLL